MGVDSAEICTAFIEAITCMAVLLWIRQGTDRENMLSFVLSQIQLIFISSKLVMD